MKCLKLRVVLAICSYNICIQGPPQSLTSNMRILTRITWLPWLIWNTDMYTPWPIVYIIKSCTFRLGGLDSRTCGSYFPTTFIWAQLIGYKIGKCQHYIISQEGIRYVNTSCRLTGIPSFGRSYRQ